LTDHQNFFAAVDTLQREWFENPVTQRFAALETLMDAAAELSGQLVQNLADYAANTLGDIYTPQRWSGQLTLVGQFQQGNYLFFDFPREASIPALVQQYRTETGVLTGLLPKEFLIPLILLAQTTGNIGQHIRQQLLVAEQQQATFHNQVQDVGADIAAAYERLYQFYDHNPIELAMYPDPLRLAATHRLDMTHNGVGPLQGVVRKARQWRHTNRLQKIGIRSAKLKPIVFAG